MVSLSPPSRAWSGLAGQWGSWNWPVEKMLAGMGASRWEGGGASKDRAEVQEISSPTSVVLGAGLNF